MSLFKKHFEWTALLLGLILMAAMDPLTSGNTFCIYERMGVPFCPGHGLGHSIAFLFRGEFKSAIDANFMGPAAVVIIGTRILSIWRELMKDIKQSINEAMGHAKIS